MVQTRMWDYSRYIYGNTGNSGYSNLIDGHLELILKGPTLFLSWTTLEEITAIETRQTCSESSQSMWSRAGHTAQITRRNIGHTPKLPSLPYFSLNTLKPQICFTLSSSLIIAPLAPPSSHPHILLHLLHGNELKTHQFMASLASNPLAPLMKINPHPLLYKTPLTIS